MFFVKVVKAIAVVTLLKHLLMFLTDLNVTCNTNQEAQCYSGTVDQQSPTFFPPWTGPVVNPGLTNQGSLTEFCIYLNLGGCEQALQS